MIDQFMLLQIFKYLIGAKDVDIHKCGRKACWKIYSLLCKYKLLLCKHSTHIIKGKSMTYQSTSFNLFAVSSAIFVCNLLHKHVMYSAKQLHAIL